MPRQSVSDPTVLRCNSTITSSLEDCWLARLECDNRIVTDASFTLQAMELILIVENSPQLKVAFRWHMKIVLSLTTEIGKQRDGLEAIFDGTQHDRY
jgi:hypothetical protein